MSQSMNHKIDPAKLQQSTPFYALPLSFFGSRAYPQGMLHLAPRFMPIYIPCCLVWAGSPFCVLNFSLALWDPHSSCFSFSRPTLQGLPHLLYYIWVCSLASRFMPTAFDYPVDHPSFRLCSHFPLCHPHYLICTLFWKKQPMSGHN